MAEVLSAASSLLNQKDVPTSTDASSSAQATSKVTKTNSEASSTVSKSQSQSQTATSKEQTKASLSQDSSSSPTSTSATAQIPTPLVPQTSTSSATQTSADSTTTTTQAATSSQAVTSSTSSTSGTSAASQQGPTTSYVEASTASAVSTSTQGHSEGTQAGVSTSATAIGLPDSSSRMTSVHPESLSSTSYEQLGVSQPPSATVNLPIANEPTSGVQPVPDQIVKPTSAASTAPISSQTPPSPSSAGVPQANIRNIQATSASTSVSSSSSVPPPKATSSTVESSSSSSVSVTTIPSTFSSTSIQTMTFPSPTTFATSTSSSLSHAPTTSQVGATPLDLGSNEKAEANSSKIPVAGIVGASVVGFFIVVGLLFLILRYCGPIRRRYDTYQEKKMLDRSYREAIDGMDGIAAEKVAANNTTSFTGQRFYATPDETYGNRVEKAHGTGLGLGNRLSLLRQHSPFQFSDPTVRESQIGMATSDPRNRGLPTLPQ